MVMRLENEFHIEDPRRHSSAHVETLRRLLASGACVEPDPKRPDFYEVASDSDVYYVHISPVSGTITLLAMWEADSVRNEEPAGVEA